MPNIVVDVDKIDNVMLALGNTELNQLNTAITSSGYVQFPYGEFNWPNITSHLKDCYNSVRRYNSWIHGVSVSMKNAMVSSTESLSGITVDKVEPK